MRRGAGSNLPALFDSAANVLIKRVDNRIYTFEMNCLSFPKDLTTVFPAKAMLVKNKAMKQRQGCSSFMFESLIQWPVPPDFCAYVHIICLLYIFREHSIIKFDDKNVIMAVIVGWRLFIFGC
jgi:hypothetical protein